MKLLKIKQICPYLAGGFLLVLFTGSNIPPEEELLSWQKKYPENALISTAKNLNVSVSISGNGLEINQEYYQEMIVLTDNSSLLADSKEYFNSHYKLNKFEAYSLVPDDKQYRKIPVQKYTRTVEVEDYVFYDDQVVYNYTFPAVGKGTKLVTRSDATTNYAFIPVIFNFGGGIPDENMSVTVSFPKDVTLIYHLFGKDTGIIKMNKEVKGDRYIYSWTASNSKTYEQDELSPDYRYVVPHLIIQIAGYQVNRQFTPVMGKLRDLYNYNYSHINDLPSEPSAAVKLLADSVTGNCSSDREKVRCIFKWVQQHIKYIAIEDGKNGLVPNDAELVLKRRYGDCKGKTSLLVSMIRSCGLKASYAWVGSRERPYRYSEFPSVVIDDHMIAVWWDGDSPVILDGTTFSHRMEDIPAFIQGKECLIEKGSEDFMLYAIPVAPAAKNSVIDSLVFQIKGDSICGKGYVSFYGENKAVALREFEGKDTSSFLRILQSLVPKASNKHLIKSVKISDPENTEQPFTACYDFILPDFITSAKGNKYISLNLDRFMQSTVLKEDRKMPVESDMTMEYRLICRLILPEGFRLQSLPGQSSFSHPLFGYIEKYAAENDHITLNSTIRLDFLLIDDADTEQFRTMLKQLNRNYLKSLTLEKTLAL